MKCKNLAESISHAIEGIMLTVHTERNMRIHLCASFVVIIAGFYFKITRLEFALITIAIGLVLISEIINTAIEVVVDILFKDFDANAKIAKDVAAGAPLIASVISIIIGLCVFGWRILEWINKL